MVTERKDVIEWCEDNYQKDKTICYVHLGISEERDNY